VLRNYDHLRGQFSWALLLGLERKARDVTRGDDERLQLFSPMRARWAEAEAAKAAGEVLE
jgi:hypothetical protein